MEDIRKRLKAREVPKKGFCWHCRKPLHARVRLAAPSAARSSRPATQRAYSHFGVPRVSLTATQRSRSLDSLGRG